MRAWSIGSIILMVVFWGIFAFMVYASWSHPFWSPLSFLAVFFLLLIDFVVRWDIPLVQRPVFHFADDTPAGRPIGAREPIGGGMYLQRVLMPKWACQSAKLTVPGAITGFMGLLTNYVVVQAIGYKEDFVDVANADKSRDGGVHFARKINNTYPSTVGLSAELLLTELNQAKKQWATVAATAHASNQELLRERGDSMMQTASKLGTALAQFRPPEPPQLKQSKEESAKE